MSAPLKHVFEQGPVIAAMGRAALSALRAKPAVHAVTPPGPWFEATLPPRSESLVRDYVRHVGGDPAAYRGTVPAHLFPQWGFPLAARAMSELPYPLARVMNAGCRLEQRAPLRAGEALLVRARIESVDDDGKRAIVTQRVVTGTKSEPDAVVADLRAFLPLSSKREPRDPSKAKARVPEGAREIAFQRIGADAGLEFAKLTGDFNPIHWLAPYARASGFRGCILHGFGTFARAIEALHRARFAGSVKSVPLIDARFTRPLVLPARVGVYVKGDGIWVGDAPSGAAYLEGHFRREAMT